MISKIKFYTILLAIFAIPLAFYPGMTDMFNPIKGILIIGFASIILFLWGLESIYLKQVLIRVSWINIIVISIFLTVFISTSLNLPFFSSVINSGKIVALNTSLFGLDGNLGTSFLIILSLTILYFAISGSLDSEIKKRSIYRVIVFSAIAIVFLTLMRYMFPGFTLKNGLDVIFTGYKNTSQDYPSYYPAINFSPIGEYYLLPLYLLICSILSIYLIRTDTDKKILILDCLPLFFSVTGLIFSASGNSFSIYFYLLASVIFAYVIAKEFRKSSNKIKKSVEKNRGILLISLIIISIALSFIFLQISGAKQVTSPLIPFDASWNVSFSSLGNSIKNGFVGTGPDSFTYSYNVYRPLSINSTNLVFEEITHAGNFFLDTIANYGLLGLGVLVFIVIKFFQFIYNNREEYNSEVENFMLIMMAFLVSFLFIPINITVLFLFFILLSVFSTIGDTNKNIKNIIFAFRKDSLGLSGSMRKLAKSKNETNIFHYVFCVFTLIIAVVGIFFVINVFSAKTLAAEVNNNLSYIADDTTADLNISKLQKSTSQYPVSDSAFRNLAQLYVRKLYNVVTPISQRTTGDTAKPTTEEASKIDTILDELGKNLAKTKDIDPLNFSNYYYQARVSLDLANISSGDLQYKYLQDSLNNIKTAEALSPQNPALYYYEGQIYYSNNDLTKAREALVISLQKFPSLDSFTKLAEILSKDKEYDAAIQSLQTAQNFYSKNSDIYNQLQQTINNLQDLKKQDSTTVTPTVTPTPKTGK